MQGLVDAFWRAAAYCLHPRVIALSLLPLVRHKLATRIRHAFASESGRLEA